MEKKNSWLKLVWFIIIICIAFGIYYFWNNYNIREENNNKLNSCLTRADISYHSNWKKSCEELGKSEDCKLPKEISERWDNLKKQAKEDCYKRYLIK